MIEPDKKPKGAFALKRTYLKALEILRRGLGLSVQNGSRRKLATGGNAIAFLQFNNVYSFQAEPYGSGLKVWRGWLFYRGQCFFFPTKIFPNTDAVYIRFPVTVTPSDISPGDPWEILSDDSTSGRPTMVSEIVGRGSEICEIRNPAGHTITVDAGVIYAPIAIRHTVRIAQELGTNQSWLVRSNGSLAKTM